MAEQRVHAECYAVYQSGERPVRAYVDGQIDVATVEDRWYSPGSTYFHLTECEFR